MPVFIFNIATILGGELALFLLHLMRYTKATTVKPKPTQSHDCFTFWDYLRL